jgi:hypothetical protein
MWMVRTSLVRTSPGSRSVVGRRRSSPVCAKLSMKAMAVEDNPHRYLDREIRHFDEQAAMQRQLGWDRSMFGW